ncbi:hypothetical protein XENTR_v10016676 [Xenopus tropicalis]|nr:hypothetical protein XENTR_v10016676 [Xenopus tropicalis]
MLRPDIVLLKESHFKASENQTLKYTNIYQSTKIAKRAGLLTMIHKDCPFEVTKVLSDPWTLPNHGGDPRRKTA